MATATLTRITEKGWHADPTGQHRLRYHDGTEWTAHATHYGPVPCLGCGHGPTVASADLDLRH